VADFKKKLEVLAEKIGQEHTYTDGNTLAQYAIDHMTPKAVVFPKNTTEISEVVRFANEEKLAIVPWGSGSKIKMGHPPRKLDLVVGTKRLNHMLDVDTQNLTITTEAGVKFRDIQARLATQEDRCYLPLGELSTEADDFICSDRSNSGCFLPIDPPGSEIATIGGVVAANSSGARRLLYSLPRDVILGVRFVTPRGDIPGSGGKTVKNVSGYDISKLMVGSMGSLGIITEITFRLLPLPEKMQTVLLAFDSFSETTELINAIFKTQLLPAAVEVMNATAFDSLGFRGAPDFSANPYIVAISLEAFGAAVDRLKTEILDLAGSNGVKATADFTEHDHLQFWLTVSGLPSFLDAKYVNLIRAKVNLRIAEWKNIFEFAEKNLIRAGIDHTIQTHSGSGICLINLLLHQEDNGAMDKAVEFMDKLLTFSRKAGGNTVVQSAPLNVKEKLAIWGEVGSDFVAMKKLKEQLDPNGVMSPGRFVGGL
jgi:glycolate oxidase FAD binding subunit